MPREIMNENASKSGLVATVAWGWDPNDGEYPLATIEIGGEAVPLEWEDAHRFVRVFRRIIKNSIRQLDVKTKK